MITKVQKVMLATMVLITSAITSTFVIAQVAQSEVSQTRPGVTLQIKTTFQQNDSTYSESSALVLDFDKEVKLIKNANNNNGETKKQFVINVTDLKDSAFIDLEIKINDQLKAAPKLQVEYGKVASLTIGDDLAIEIIPTRTQINEQTINPS